MKTHRIHFHINLKKTEKNDDAFQPKIRAERNTQLQKSVLHRTFAAKFNERARKII